MARLAEPVCCVRCELGAMNGDLARVIFFLFILKIVVQSMGWSQ